MAGFFYIGTKKGKLYHLGVCGNPEAMVRKMVSKLGKGDYSEHPFLCNIQKPFDEYGKEDLITGSWNGVEASTNSEEFKDFVNDRHRKMQEMGFINLLDVRDPEKEYPSHLEKILKKTRDILEQGLISVDDFDEYLDNL